MKRRFVGLYVAFAGCMVCSVFAYAMGVHPVVAIGLIILSCLFFVLTMRSWFGIVNNLVYKSNEILHKQDQELSSWSLEGVDVLEQNQEQLKRKLKISADLISNLAHHEKEALIGELHCNDPIRKALERIKDEMQKIKEDDDRRAWTSQGLAHFSEVLRDKHEIREYAYRIISALVKYINANQGGLFVEYMDTDKERYLELAACYAYGKRKYVDNRIAEGQGLLGQCMLEKELILITNVPNDYVKITSGLGEALPRCIIVIPLIFNEEFCGAIELAGFEIFKPYQIDFLRKVCESIASEVVSMRAIERTRILLEESNLMAQELKASEEVMKQNMEQLAATQEEMTRKQAELSGVINAIDSTLATAEFDANGSLVRYNSIFQQFFGSESAYLQSKNYLLITGGNELIAWEKVLSGNIRTGDFKTRTGSGSDLWLSVTFTPIMDTNRRPLKVLCMIQNITQKKVKEIEFERLSIVANNTDNSVIITDSNGLIEYVNAGFTKMTGYSAHEVLGLKPGKLLQGPLTEKKTIAKLRQHIAAGIPVNEEILNYNKRKESYWVSLAINPVKDSEGIITNYISVQADITQTKIDALDFHQKMEALSRSNAIIEMDKNGYLLDVNDNYLEILGYHREELIGKPYTLLTRKENVFEKLMNTIDEHGVQSGVFSRYDKNGEKHCMKLMDYPVLNINGEIVKIIEFGVDVSNEKRLEKEAERRQSELKSYLGGINNTIASAEFSVAGEFTDANEIFLKVIGYSKDELAGKSFDYLMGDDPSVIMMWENLRLGKFFSGEFKMNDKTGKELWLTGTFNPILIETDKPEKIMMFAQFTTQVKEKLNDLNAMVNALKSTLPVLEFNADLTCKTANDKAMKLFSLTRLQLRSKSIFDFIPPYHHDTWSQNKEEMLSNEFRSFIMPFVAGDQIVNYEVSVTVTRNLEGKVAKMIILLVKQVLDKVSLLTAV